MTMIMAGKKKWKRYGNADQGNKYQCFYCGCGLNETIRTVDHIVPKSMGGILSNDNKVFACKRCNQFKADVDPETFLGMVKFLSREFDATHEEKMSYYRRLEHNLSRMVKQRNEKDTGDSKHPS
jgi:5-methylcytosine-specific restriction endonuclease McrA